MRVLLIMDPGIPVPPKLYGGIERMVYLYAEEYLKLGHEVTLLAGPDSSFSGHTITFGKNDLSRSNWVKMKEVFFVWRLLLQQKKSFDVIHNFGFTKLYQRGKPVHPEAIATCRHLRNKPVGKTNVGRLPQMDAPVIILAIRTVVVDAHLTVWNRHVFAVCSQ